METNTLRHYQVCRCIVGVEKQRESQRGEGVRIGKKRKILEWQKGKEKKKKRLKEILFSRANVKKTCKIRVPKKYPSVLKA